jgi:DNA-binding CsgD family transcriptional regulator
MEEPLLFELVDSIYEAAIDPEKYTDFLTKLSLALRSPASGLIAYDASISRASIVTSVGLDEATLRRDRHYAAQNPFVARGGDFLYPGAVFTGDMIVPDQELVRTDFYNHHMRLSDLHHVIGATVSSDSFGAALLTSARPRRQDPFEEAELQLYRALDPHLRRSLDVQRRLAAQDGQREALDKIPTGCVLLGRNGKVLSLNEAAERVLARRDGIVYSNGRLEAPALDSGARLRELISSATSTLYQSHPGGMMAVHRPSAAQPYTVLVAPFAKTPVDWGGCFPVAVVFITDPGRTALTEDAMVQLFHFTPAEARLARALSNGEGLGQAAEQLAIGINTAKTHLQHIFAKTQTSRQAELVRLLAGVAAMTGLEPQAPPTYPNPH